MDNYKIGSWLFMSGCLMFTLDTIKKKPISKPLFLGCNLFNLGCIFFLKDAYDKKNES